MTNEEFLTYVDCIKRGLQDAQQHASKLRTIVQQQEGDTDLFRKLEFYTLPNILHWLDGEQAGNVKDLDTTLRLRIAPIPAKKKAKKK